MDIQFRGEEIIKLKESGYPTQRPEIAKDTQRDQ
jgi:hypothetical protein